MAKGQKLMCFWFDNTISITVLNIFVIISFFFSVMYYNYAGGVIAMNKQNFKRINGYANSYWGWGNEDDDFSARYVISIDHFSNL